MTRGWSNIYNGGLAYRFLVEEPLVENIFVYRKKPL